MKKIFYLLLIFIHTYNWSFDDEPVRWWQAAAQEQESVKEISESLYDSIIRKHGPTMGREILKGMLAEAGENLGYFTKTAGEKISDLTSLAASYVPQFSFANISTFPSFVKSHPITVGATAAGFAVVGYMARQKMRKNKLVQDKNFFDLLDQALPTQINLANQTVARQAYEQLNRFISQYQKYIPNAKNLIDTFIGHAKKKEFDKARTIQFYMQAKISAQRLDEMVNDIGLSDTVKWPEKIAESEQQD